jgi:hypothetical protein
MDPICMYSSFYVLLCFDHPATTPLLLVLPICVRTVCISQTFLKNLATCWTVAKRSPGRWWVSKDWIFVGLLLFVRGLVQSYSNSGRKFLVYLDSGSGTLSSGIPPGQMAGVIISRLPTEVSISIFPVIPRGYPLSIMGQLQIRFLPVLSVE